VNATVSSGICVSSVSYIIDLGNNMTFNPILLSGPTNCGVSDGEINLTGFKINSQFVFDYKKDGVSITPSLNLTSDNNGTITISSLGIGLYNEFTTIRQSGGCEGVSLSSITFNDPIRSIVTIPLKYTICQRQTATLTARPTIPVGDFIWNRSAASTLFLTFDVNPISNTTYILTYVLLGCRSIEQETSVDVFKKPVVSFVTDKNIGCIPLEVTLNINTPIDLLGTEAIWDFGNGSTVALPTDDTKRVVTHKYIIEGVKGVSLTLKNAGCSTTATSPDYILVIPQAKATVDRTLDFVTSTRFTYTNSSINAVNYKWKFSDTLMILKEENIDRTFPEKEGLYTVKLVTSPKENLCADSTEITIRLKDELLYYVPNTFDPLSGVNPVFKPQFTSGFVPSSYHITIFNKWGHEVFHTNDPNSYWDGRYSGASLGVIYNWIIEFKDKETDVIHLERGAVTLIR